MMRRILLLATVVTLLVVASASVVMAEPDNSPAFDRYVGQFVQLEPNPCTGEVSVVTFDFEAYFHEFERPNGFHQTGLFWITTTDEVGVSTGPRMVGPEILNVNGGTSTFTSILNTVGTSLDGDRFKVQHNVHATVVDGELVAGFDRVSFRCLTPHS
jgi:hypothetical protein